MKFLWQESLLLVVAVCGSWGTLLAQSSNSTPANRASNRPTEFLAHANGHKPSRESHTWAIFLGTGWTAADLDRARNEIKASQWINPFTGQPFKDVVVYAFGQDNLFAEVARVGVGDHFDLQVGGPHDADFTDTHIEYAICHSNGCTRAFANQRDGVIDVGHFLALGTDWTSRHFAPGELRGAEATFFVATGDFVPHIPAPHWERITEDTPGLAFSFSFGTPQEIPQAIHNQLKHGRSDADRYKVIHLDPPPGMHATPLAPVRPHALIDSYFAAIEKWSVTADPEAEQLRREIRRRDPLAPPAGLTAGAGPPPPPPPPPPGGGPGGSGLGVASSGPGAGPLSRASGLPDLRGGVSADVTITEDDFERR